MIDGKSYIGKKRIWRLKAKKIHKESDWRTYFGSNKELLEELESDLYGEEHFTREILKFCVSDGEMRYWEECFQYCPGLLNLPAHLRDSVLTAKLPSGEDAWYNSNIGMSVTKKAVQGYFDDERRAKWLKQIANQKKKAGL